MANEVVGWVTANKDLAGLDELGWRTSFDRQGGLRNNWQGKKGQTSNPNEDDFPPSLHSTYSRFRA
jgi:hypothetical protein